MRTVTVKLGKHDYQLLTEITEMLQKDWIEKMTKSEAIRYAIYSQWCDLKSEFPDDPNSCKKCTKEHYLQRKT